MKNKKGVVSPIIILIAIILVIFGINYYLNQQKTITINGDNFDKNNLKISKGDFVIFKNENLVNKVIIIENNRYFINSNKDQRIVFKERGVYIYHLENNEKVNGTIIVI